MKTFFTLRQEHHCIFPFIGCLKITYTVCESRKQRKGVQGLKGTNSHRALKAADKVARGVDVQNTRTPAAPALCSPESKARKEPAELEVTLPSAIKIRKQITQFWFCCESGN